MSDSDYDTSNPIVRALQGVVAEMQAVSAAMQDSMGAQRLPGSGTFAFRRMTDPLLLEVGPEPTRFDVPPGFFDEGGPGYLSTTFLVVNGNACYVRLRGTTTGEHRPVTRTTGWLFPPDIEVVTGWLGDQMIAGGVTAQSLTGCSVLAKRSRGTLLLTSGPFETAPAGVPVTIRAIGS